DWNEANPRQEHVHERDGADENGDGLPKPPGSRAERKRELNERGREGEVRGGGRAADPHTWSSADIPGNDHGPWHRDHQADAGSDEPRQEAERRVPKLRDGAVLL